jgi:hypothetical protein
MALIKRANLNRRRRLQSLREIAMHRRPHEKMVGGHGQTQSQLHGGDKFSFLNSGSKPSERHSFNSLICAGGGSTDRVFVGFALLALRLSVLALT